MLNLLFVFWIVASVQDPADSSAAYDAVLKALHQEYAGSALFLANPPVARIRISKDARPAENEFLHPAAWVGQLRQKELIAGTCTPPPDRVGCRGVIPITDPEPVTVQFWTVNSSNPHSMEVPVTLVLPPIRGIPNIEKRIYLLARSESGTWRIVSQTLVGIT